MMEAFRNVFRSSAQKKEARAKAEAAKAESGSQSEKEEDLKNRDVFVHGIETLFDKNRGEPIEYADADVFNDNRYVDYSEQQKALRKVETSVKREQNKLIGIADDYLQTDEKDTGSSEKEKRFEETEKSEILRNGHKEKAEKEAKNKAEEKSWRFINVFGNNKSQDKKNQQENVGGVEKGAENTEFEKESIRSALKTLDLKPAANQPNSTKISTATSTKVQQKSRVKDATVSESKSIPKDKKVTENQAKSSLSKVDTTTVAKEVASKPEVKASTTKTQVKKATEVKKAPEDKKKSPTGKPEPKLEEVEPETTVQEKVTNFEKLKKNLDNKATVVRPQPGVRSVKTTETSIVRSKGPAKTSTRVSSSSETSVRTVTTTSSSSTVSEKKSVVESSSKSSTPVRRSSVQGAKSTVTRTKDTTTTAGKEPVRRQISAGSQSKSSDGSRVSVTTTSSRVTEKGGKVSTTGTPAKRAPAARTSGTTVKETTTTVRKVTAVKRSPSDAKGAESKAPSRTTNK